MRIIGLYTYNRLRKIHRGSDDLSKFACGSRDMVHPGTKVKPLAMANMPIWSNLSLICGNCWNTKTKKVVINPNEHRLS